jgi:hypothetical protein
MIGRMVYRDLETGAETTRRFAGPGRPGTMVGVVRITDDVIRISVERDQSAIFDTPEFAVTGGVGFETMIPLRAAPGSIESGYIAVAFFDSVGKEVGRHYLSLSPGRQQVGMAKTNSDGKFALTLQKTSAPDPSYRAEYLGDKNHRLAFVVLQ